MRLASAWFFVVKDTAAYLRRNKRAVLFALFFVLIGEVIGVIMSLGIEEAVYLSHLSQILQNDYNAFSGFFNFALITLICMSLTYLSLISKYTRIVPYFLLLYCGYIMGRAIILNIVVCKIVGLISLIMFIIPAYFAMLCALIVLIIHIREIPFCGAVCLIPSRNPKTIKFLAKCFFLCVSIYFGIFVILGGIMSIIINIA